MQTEYYHSPCSHELPSDGVAFKRRHKWPALVIFSSLIAVFLVALIVIRVISPDGWLFSWEQLVPKLEASFHFEIPEELLPEEFRDEFDGFQADLPFSDTKVKYSLPRADLAPDVQMILHASREELSFQEIYNKTISSIVSIEVYGTYSSATGTGVILTEDGYIVTNHHIIENSTSGYVVLSDGSEYEAKLVGSDAESDLAVLKIDAQGLVAAEFGDSDRIQVGDTVLAIGNPLGSELFGTMTEGIVSAINRDVNVDGYHMSLLQTTAALNPGNSGGALINTAGQVIGITNMKMMSDYETIEGLGFAIPSVWTKEVVDALLDQGMITGRPTIGINCFALMPGAAEIYGRDSGIYIDSVTSNGPAEKAGLHPGDIIVSVNGQEVTTLDEFTLIRDEVGVGGVLELSVWRDGKFFETHLTLVEQYELH